MGSADELTRRVKELAGQAGFARVGIAAAGTVGDGDRFRRWVGRGMHASMGYLARNVEKRLRPDRLVEGARSVICLAAGYAPGEGDPNGEPGVARYARGRDYHKVLKRRCGALMGRLRQLEPLFEGRAFVDSAPLLERGLARAAGIGWIGRNRCLTVPGLGSYVFLCEIVSNLPLAPDRPSAEGCDGCGACLAACPTGALGEAGLDARRCVSYLTVEHAGAIDAELWPRMGRRLVGCDACQEACPHNREAGPGDPELRASEAPLGGASLADVLDWAESDWDLATRGSAARRASWAMMLRNAAIAAGNSAGRDDAPVLQTALQRLRARRPELAGVIDWAIDRLSACPGGP